MRRNTPPLLRLPPVHLLLLLMPFSITCGPFKETIADETATEAQDATLPQRLYADGVPETGFLTLKTDQYTLVMDAASGWTIEKMFFEENLFGLHNGHYGTVLVPQGGEWWGTGHQEGGREVVHSLKLVVDGKTIPLKMGETVTGQKIQLIKNSTVWKFDAKVEIVLTNDHLYERTQMKAKEDCETSTFYYFMHIFPTTTTAWLAKLTDGTFKQGELSHAGDMKLSQDCSWIAQYDPVNQSSYLCYTPKVIHGTQSASMIWDLERYHKYYLRYTKGEAFEKDKTLDFSVFVKVVPNETGDWMATKKSASDLIRRFPPLP